MYKYAAHQRIQIEQKGIESNTGLPTAGERLAERKIEVIVLQLGKLDLGSSAGKLTLAMLASTRWRGVTAYPGQATSLQAHR